MATTSDYLNQLIQDKQDLVDNLVEQGVEASYNETFTSLVPKVLDIEGGGGEEDVEMEMRKSDLLVKLYTTPYLVISEKNYTSDEVQKVDDLITLYEQIYSNEGGNE